MSHIEIEEGAREEEAVRSIQDASMPRDEGAGVLHRQSPLEQGFRQVSQLTSDAQEDSQEQRMDRSQLGKKPPLGEEGSTQTEEEARNASLHRFSWTQRGTKPVPAEIDSKIEGPRVIRPSHGEEIVDVDGSLGQLSQQGEETQQEGEVEDAEESSPGPVNSERKVLSPGEKGDQEGDEEESQEEQKVIAAKAAMIDQEAEEPSTEQAEQFEGAQALFLQQGKELIEPNEDGQRKDKKKEVRGSILDQEIKEGKEDGRGEDSLSMHPRALGQLEEEEGVRSSWDFLAASPPAAVLQSSRSDAPSSGKQRSPPSDRRA